MNAPYPLRHHRALTASLADAAVELEREVLRDEGRRLFDEQNALVAAGKLPADRAMLPHNREAFANINANFGRPVRMLSDRAQMVGYSGEAA